MAFFRPKPAMTIASVISLGILLALGNWQLQRLAWKLDLIAGIEARTDLDPIPLEAALSQFSMAEIAYTPVNAQGRFDHAREVHLFGRSTDDGIGYFIYTPLLREGAPTVIVNRGFVDQALVAPETRAQGQIEGQVQVTGLARPPAERGWFQPTNNLGTNEWYYRDLAAMAAYMGVPDVAPVFIDQGGGQVPGGIPRGGETRLVFKNDHLAYAFTWFGLAMTLIGVYIAVHISEGRLAPDFFRRRSNKT